MIVDTASESSPRPVRYYVERRSEEGQCDACGEPLAVGDPVVAFARRAFCSVSCSLDWQIARLGRVP